MPVSLLIKMYDVEIIDAEISSEDSTLLSHQGIWLAFGRCREPNRGRLLQDSCASNTSWADGQ